MDREFKTTIVNSVIVAGVLFSLLFIPEINRWSSSEQLITRATYLKERQYIISTEIGTKGGVRLSFRLNSGEVIEMPKGRPLKVGDQVSIYYRKGGVFKNNIYEYYEPLQTND